MRIVSTAGRFDIGRARAVSAMTRVSGPSRPTNIAATTAAVARVRQLAREPGAQPTVPERGDGLEGREEVDRRPPAVSSSPIRRTKAMAIESRATARARYTTMCGNPAPEGLAEGRPRAVETMAIEQHAEGVDLDAARGGA